MSAVKIKFVYKNDLSGWIEGVYSQCSGLRTRVGKQIIVYVTLGIKCLFSYDPNEKRGYFYKITLWIIMQPLVYTEAKEYFDKINIIYNGNDTKNKSTW